MSPRRTPRGALWLVGWLGVGCATPPPVSQFPSADAALGRLHEGQSCSRTVEGEATVDYFGEEGRIRAKALFVVARPSRLRVDVLSPFGTTLSTFTADGSGFALLDVGGRAFHSGDASPCNLARFLRVPVPGHALAGLLAGDAPVLVHAPGAARIRWEAGAYTIDIEGSVPGTSERLRLGVHPEDHDRAWAAQRLRLLEASVTKRGVELYGAELGHHAPAGMAGPRVDPDGLEPDLPPSGPACRAELPRTLRIRSEATAQDLLLTHDSVVHNPPFEPAVFRQSPPGGVRRFTERCEGGAPGAR